MDQHHPEVGGKVAGQEVPLEGSVKEPDLRVGGCQVNVNVAGVVNLSSVRLGREDKTDFASSLAPVQLKYLPPEPKLRMLRLTRLRHSVLRTLRDYD